MNDKLGKIMLVYELATTMLTPKSYKWKEVAKTMYEIATLTERKDK